VSRYATTPLIVALSSGHSDINIFRPWSPIVTDRKSFGSRLKKKIQYFLRRMTPLMFLIRVQAFRDSLCRELPLVQNFMND